MNKKKWLALAGLGLVGLGVYARRRDLLARALGLPPSRFDVDVRQNLRVPMRDGITLAADHFFPRAAGIFPTILIRTPYGRRRGGGLLHIFVAQRFAERGYHVITQDTRGRFDSEGEFIPFVHEHDDGLDTLDWIGQQPWFDGRLGMWGPSYEGYVQWAVAADAPDHLRVLNPSITGSQLNPFTGSAFGLDTMVRWLLNLAQGEEPFSAVLMRLLDQRAVNRTLARAFRHMPLRETDQIALGRPVPFYREWLEHPHMDDPFWQDLYHGTRMESVRAAVHLVGGWYDILLHPLLRDYAALRAAGHRPYLTIGPWKHLDIACAGEALRSGIVWSEAQLKGNLRYLRNKPVRLYVMTASEGRGIAGDWREFDSFPPPATETRFYLQPDRRLARELAPADSAPDTYCYDPVDPTPAVGGPLFSLEGGAVNNRALETRSDVLAYTTAPFEREHVVIGPVGLELHVRSSLGYTDFFGRVCDVYPDGRSINICDGIIRLTPADGEMQVDGSRRIQVDLWATAYRFQPGHALRLLVASGAHPRWARNPGTGEPLATASDLLASNQTVYHDAAHPSALVVPIVGRV